MATRSWTWCTTRSCPTCSARARRWSPPGAWKAAASWPRTCWPSTTRPTCPRKWPTRWAWRTASTTSTRRPRPGRSRDRHSRADRPSFPAPSRNAAPQGVRLVLPELGQIALLLALLAALLQAALPLAGAAGNHRPAWMAVARPAALAQLLLLAFAYAVLTLAFVRQDFSVTYVANNSNTLLPLVYRYTAVWGSHEGSLLLWVLMLGVWNAAVALWSRALPQVVAARVLGVIGLVAIGFLSFMIFTSNPFARLLP